MATTKPNVQNADSFNNMQADLRTKLATLFAGELEALPSLLEDASPKERLDFSVKLLPYVLAKVEHEVNDDDDNIAWTTLKID